MMGVVARISIDESMGSEKHGLTETYYNNIKKT